MSKQMPREVMNFIVNSVEAHYLMNYERLRDATLSDILDDYAKEYVKSEIEKTQRGLAKLYSSAREVK
jgi:hypothetical protein